MKRGPVISFVPSGVLWILVLFIAAARLFAAPATNAPPPVNKDPQVKSVYNNLNNRPDPFLPVKSKGKGVEAKADFDDGEFKLQGILWDPTNPVAVVNRKRIFLNESATLKLPSGEATVTAVSIDRNRVVLKVGSRQVELQMER